MAPADVAFRPDGDDVLPVLRWNAQGLPCWSAVPRAPRAPRYELGEGVLSRDDATDEALEPGRESGRELGREGCRDTGRDLSAEGVLDACLDLSTEAPLEAF